MDAKNEKGIDPMDEVRKIFKENNLRVFGENLLRKYGEGTYEDKDDLMNFLGVGNPMGDNIAKDMAMVVLQPISLVIGNALDLAGNLQGAAFFLIPALVSDTAATLFVVSLAKSMINASTLILAAVAPLARLYNLSCRAYASLKTDLPAEVSKGTELAPKLVAGDKAALKEFKTMVKEGKAQSSLKSKSTSDYKEAVGRDRSSNAQDSTSNFTKK